MHEQSNVCDVNKPPMLLAETVGMKTAPQLWLGPTWTLASGGLSHVRAIPVAAIRNLFWKLSCRLHMVALMCRRPPLH